MVSERTKNRGQLILIGALMLATVIFGLSLLLNSMLFTGAAGDTGADVAVEETNHLDYDVEMSARELLVRLNHGDRNRTVDELGENAHTQMRNLSRAFGESRARSSSAAVSLEYDASSSVNGTRIVQDYNTDMDDPNPISGSSSRVGWFSMSVNASAIDEGDIMTVESSNGTDDIDIVLERTSEGITVNSGDPCRPERGRVLLDLYSGRGFTDDCEFTGIGTLDRPTSIEFTDGGDFEGKYAIVTNEPWDPSNPPFDQCSNGGGLSPEDADPCAAPAIWEANITTNVVSDSVAYENEYDLTIYTNDR